MTIGEPLAKRVMDLPGWPPQPGGSRRPGDVRPRSTDDVTIESMLRYANEKLMFTCTFRGTSFSYDFPMPDHNTAKKVAAILKDHVGQTLTSIAFVEIPINEA